MVLYGKPSPMYRESVKVSDDLYLTLAVFPGKKDSQADNIIAQIRQKQYASDGRTELWTTIARIPVQRTRDRAFNKLPVKHL